MARSVLLTTRVSLRTLSLCTARTEQTDSFRKSGKYVWLAAGAAQGHRLNLSHDQRPLLGGVSGALLWVW